MSIIPDGHAEVSLKFNCAASPHYAFCVFGVRNFDDHTAEYIAVNARIDWSESLSIIQTDEWSLRSTKAVTGEGTFFEDTAAVGGSLGQASAPPQVSYLLKKQTNFVGRDKRGRMFVPGVAEGKVSNIGAVPGDWVATVTGAAESFLGKLNADGIPMVVLHSTSLLLPPVVDAFVCDPFVATQRRRLR